MKSKCEDKCKACKKEKECRTNGRLLIMVEDTPTQVGQSVQNVLDELNPVNRHGIKETLKSAAATALDPKRPIGARRHASEHTRIMEMILAEKPLSAEQLLSLAVAIEKSRVRELEQSLNQLVAALQSGKGLQVVQVPEEVLKDMDDNGTVH